MNHISIFSANILIHIQLPLSNAVIIVSVITLSNDMFYYRRDNEQPKKVSYKNLQNAFI
jgi:hypothetical protein